MNESGLGIYGTGYRANTARQNTIQDNLFLQTSSIKKKSLRQKTKTDNEMIFSTTTRVGTTTLQSHRSRYVSMQQETRANSVQSSRMSSLFTKPSACKNYNCLKNLDDLQKLYEEQQKIIKDLTNQIEELRNEIQQKKKITIYEDKLKQRLISSTQRVQVQKSLGMFGFVQDSQQLFATSKTDSVFMPRTISQHNKTDNNYQVTQPQLIDIYSKSLLQNYCYSSVTNKLPLPYIKCDKCELIKNQHIVRLECKHQYHVSCLIDDIHSQILKQQEKFCLTTFLYCQCGAYITLTFIKTLYQPQFNIIYHIIANLQLFNLVKTYQLDEKKEIILKCAKEHCNFIILSTEDKISYCPLCCEFNQFVQINFI